MPENMFFTGDVILDEKYSQEKKRNKQRIMSGFLK